MQLNLDTHLERFNLNPNHRTILANLGKRLDKYMDGVLEAFYQDANSNAKAASFFTSKATADHARSAQRKHWKMLFSGDFTNEYIESCNRIGAIHFKIKLPFELYLSSYARATSDIQAALIKESGKMQRFMSGKKMAEEIGILNRAFALDTSLVIDAYFANQSTELENTFDYIESAVEKMSQGDLNAEITKDSAPDFAEQYESTRSSWNFALRDLSSTMKQIKDTVNNASHTANEIERSVNGLATRAESQAASLEETTAAISELSRSVSKTADNSVQMDTVTRKAKSDMVTGTCAMKEAAGAMSRISKASDEINQIISLIDDISFQTNLLALNAGVEAARAGEAGRGFAVVAAEVRNLAASSSNAAKQIKELIDRSSQEVTDGVKLVGSANDALDQVVKQFDEVTELATTVSTATSDQAANLVEASSAVNEMDQITQKNAAMASDTTHRLKELVNVVDNLTEQLQHFKAQESDRSTQLARAA